MKKYLVITLIALLALPACKEKGYPKPKQLLSESDMVDILYDIHLAESVSNRNRFNPGDSIRIESKDIYQAVLNKHELTDSVFALNLIYYSAKPKVYEKIYTKVVDRLNMAIEGDRQNKDLSVQQPEP